MAQHGKRAIQAILPSSHNLNLLMSVQFWGRYIKGTIKMLPFFYWCQWGHGDLIRIIRERRATSSFSMVGAREKEGKDNRTLNP